MIAEQLEQMLRKSSHTVAFTGAGISTLSGIRDFRGKNGVYLEPWHGRPVEEILSLDCFLREPELFYGWAAEFLYRLDEFQPAAVHRALALLEQKGLLASIYTQNIDLLHQKAGSSRVYELHGTTASAAAGSSPTGRSHRRCWPEKCRTAPRAES